MNIMILNDFSVPSQKALAFAQQLAVETNGNLFQLHVILKNEENDSPEILKMVTAAAQIKLEESASGLTQKGAEDKTSPSMTNIVKAGKLEKVVSGVLEEKAIDLIVLGTREKHNLIEYFMGSTSTLLFSEVDIPVVIVPEKSEVSSVEKIAIAIEEKTARSFAQFVTKLSEQLKAKLARVNVFPLPNDISDKKEEKYNPTWFEDELDPDEEITIIRDLFVVDGLDFYIKKHQIDLLAMWVPRRKGLERWLHRSVSKQMIYRSSIPLLIQSGS